MAKGKASKYPRWRKMSTAPRDGVPFLAWYPHFGECRLILWTLPIYEEKEGWAVENPEGEKWPIPGYWGDATGWMPAPPGPEGDAA